MRLDMHDHIYINKRPEPSTEFDKIKEKEIKKEAKGIKKAKSTFGKLKRKRK